jgi:hypothetical protein
LSGVRAARADRGGRRIPQPGRTSAMADVGLIVLTILLFGLLALTVKGVERL